MSNRIELSDNAKKALDRLTAARRQISYYKDVESEARAVIEAELGDAHDAGTVNGVDAVIWKTIKSNRFDSSALKKDFPDLHALFTKTTESRRFEVR